MTSPIGRHAFRRGVVILSALLSLSADLVGSTLVIDSFSEGELNFLLPGGDNREITDDVLGRQRFAYIERSDPAVTISATQPAGGSSLSFAVDASSAVNSTNNILQIDYQDFGVVNLLGYDAFQLTFSSLSGIGNLIIRFNDDRPLNPDLARLTLDRPGVVLFPFSSAEGFDTIDQTHQFEISFLNVSPEFSFALEEIRLTPEPSITVLASLGALCFLRRRRTEESRG